MSFVVGQRVLCIDTPYPANFSRGDIVTVSEILPDYYGRQDDAIRVEGDSHAWLVRRFEAIEPTLDEYKARVSKEIDRIQSQTGRVSFNDVRKNLGLSIPTKKVRLTFEVEVEDNGQKDVVIRLAAFDKVSDPDLDLSRFLIESVIVKNPAI